MHHAACNLLFEPYQRTCSLRSGGHHVLAKTSWPRRLGHPRSTDVISPWGYNLEIGTDGRPQFCAGVGFAARVGYGVSAGSLGRARAGAGAGCECRGGSSRGGHIAAFGQAWCDKYLSWLSYPTCRWERGPLRLPRVVAKQAAVGDPADGEQRGGLVHSQARDGVDGERANQPRVS